MAINQGSNFFSPVTSTLGVAFTDENKLALFAKCTGAPPTTAATFQHGALMIRTDSGSGNPALYENTGTTAVPVWNLVGAISAGEITLAQYRFLEGNGSGVAAASDNIRGASGLNGISVGDGTATGTIQSEGNFNLELKSGNATTGSIRIVDGANGDIEIRPNGTGQLSVVSAVAGGGAVVGAVLDLFHDDVSLAATDIPGRVSFRGKDDGDNETEWGRIDAVITNVTDTSEEADLIFYTIKGGSEGSQALLFDTSTNTLDVGDGSNIAVVSSNGSQDLRLETGNATTGTITIIDGADGNIQITPNGSGTVEILGSGGLGVAAQSVTPNNDSGSASTINPGVTAVDVQAVTTDANDWIVLPSLSSVPVGHTIKIACNAGTNFEMRTPSTSGELINTVDSDGTQEYLCTDTEVITITKVSNADGWVATAQTALGSIATAVVPD